MNTNPDAVKILCYGDSNTWGQKPDKTGRYTANIRWTGQLQDKLGNGYYVVEEGLSSRTTDLEYSKPGRNGKTYLTPCLLSHNPIDVVVMMLGTNDFKIEFNRDSEETADAIKRLVEDIRKYGKTGDGGVPKIVIVSPIHINSRAPAFSDFYSGIYDETSETKSKLLSAELAKISKESKCYFIDASTVAEPGRDGIHMGEPSHAALANLVYAKVEEIV